MKRINKIHYFWELLIQMTYKELAVHYKYTIFGFFWIFLNPLLQMFIIGFVFTFFIKQIMPHYFYKLFLGLLVWNFFSLSLTKATSSIVNERFLISKAAFPREVIPLSLIFSNFVHFLLSLVLFLVAVYAIHTVTITGLLLVIGIVLWLLFFTIGISFLTAALNVRFRDVNFFVQAMLTIWFYATPIIYSRTLIPIHFQVLWYINPLTSIIELMEMGFLRINAINGSFILVNFAISFVIFILGVFVFQKESKYFDDWI